jgi:hypothetical protein
LTAPHLGIVAAVVLIQEGVAGFDRQLAALRHRVTRIHGEIEQRSLELVGVNLNLP